MLFNRIIPKSLTQKEMGRSATNCNTVLSDKVPKVLALGKIEAVFNQFIRYDTNTEAHTNTEALQALRELMTVLTVERADKLNAKEEIFMKEAAHAFETLNILKSIILNSIKTIKSGPCFQ
jgi:hypothetical protein